MASTINASSSGSGGLISTGDASGVLQLQSNGTVSLQVDTSANVGIGTTNANGYKLAIGDGASNRGRIYLKGATGGNYPEINIDDTMNTSGKNYQLYSTGGVLKVQNQTDAAVSFVSNAFGIGLGDNAAVSGTGIRFPATSSVSSNANTLDDYEIGTWTLSPGNFNFTGNKTGSYIKIGRLVFLNFLSDVTGQSYTGSGSGWYIGGLPFTIDTAAVMQFSECSAWNGNVAAIDNIGSNMYARNNAYTVSGIGNGVAFNSSGRIKFTLSYYTTV